MGLDKSCLSVSNVDILGPFRLVENSPLDKLPNQHQWDLFLTTNHGNIFKCSICNYQVYAYFILDAQLTAIKNGNPNCKFEFIKQIMES